MRSLRVTAMGVLCAQFVSAALAQTLIYEQSPESSTQDGAFANINHEGSPQRLADDFTVAEQAEVGRVSWWGFTTTGLAPADTSNIAGFQIDFLASDGFFTNGSAGAPGTLLATETVDFVDLTVTSFGPGPFGGDAYRFDADLATPVQLAGPATYWVSINAIAVDPSVTAPVYSWTFQGNGGGTIGTMLIAFDGFPSNSNPLDGVWARSTSTTFSFALFTPAVVDSDGDGIQDADEVVLGSDPNNPDTDGDGIDDGEELDLFDNGGCHDLLNPDSDGDGLLDGEEVDLGTSPCNTDSDLDGLPDNIDPLPLDPEGTIDAIETDLRTLAEFVWQQDLSLFTGRRPIHAFIRRAFLSRGINRAANWIACDLPELAIIRLEFVLARVDGDPSPPDWMIPSETTDFIRQEIEDQIFLIGFLLDL